MRLAARWDQIRRTPRHCDRQPDERQVHVAIRVRLEPDLHQADHGDERAQVPEPADDEVGSTARAAQRSRGKQRE